MGELVAFANQKGGVGKTTTVVSVASFLALDGRRVLLVGMDPQGNATSGVGLDKDSVERAVYDVLVGGARIPDVARQTAIRGLSILPADRGLAGAEVELVPNPARERTLRRVMEESRNDYDHILLDCPPSLGLLTVNALTAADGVVIPLQCEYYALTEVRGHFGERVFASVVPRSVRRAEAPSYGLPIGLYSADSRGAQAYRSITAEFLERSGKPPGPTLQDTEPIDPSRTAEHEQEVVEA